MKGNLQNKWLRLGISAVSCVYALLLIWFAYNSFLYELVITSAVSFGFLYVLLNISFLVIMLYSRKEKLTSLVSLFLLPIVFFIVLMNLSNPLVTIPPLVVSAVIFFSCKNRETLKTILATVYVLLYVLGIIVFLIVRLLFGSSVDQTRLTPDVLNNAEIMALYTEADINKANTNVVSPDGKYRYYIVDVNDKSKGRVLLNVEYNDLDKTYSSFSFVGRGYERKVSFTETRGTGNIPDVKWVANDIIEYKYPDSEPERTKIEEINKDLLGFFYE